VFLFDSTNLILFYIFNHFITPLLILLQWWWFSNIAILVNSSKFFHSHFLFFIFIYLFFYIVVFFSNLSEWINVVWLFLIISDILFYNFNCIIQWLVQNQWQLVCIHEKIRFFCDSYYKNFIIWFVFAMS
jgi:hypothetical protein